MVAALSLTATSRGQPNVSHRVASSPVGSGWQHREAIQSFMQSLLAPAEESTLGARPTETSSSETLVFLIITSDHCQANSEAMVYSVREMISVELIRCRHKTCLRPAVVVVAFFLDCEDSGRMFGHSFPACAFFEKVD